jgi:hypothetical protein
MKKIVAEIKGLLSDRAFFQLQAAYIRNAHDTICPVWDERFSAWKFVFGSDEKKGAGEFYPIKEFFLACYPELSKIIERPQPYGWGEDPDKEPVTKDDLNMDFLFAGGEK